MSKPKIIAFKGRAGSGKDTAASYVAEALRSHQRNVHTLAFADPIRQMLLAMGVPERYMMERDLKEQPIPGFNGASYRHLAQTLGDWGRSAMGATCYVNLVRQRLDRLAEVGALPDYLLVTDLRYSAEALWLEPYNGVIVHVERPGVAPVRRHGSEEQQLAHHFVLDNSGDQLMLRRQCQAFAAELLDTAAGVYATQE